MAAGAGRRSFHEAIFDASSGCKLGLGIIGQSSAVEAHWPALAPGAAEVGGVHHLCLIYHGQQGEVLGPKPLDDSMLTIWFDGNEQQIYMPIGSERSEGKMNGSEAMRRASITTNSG